jgi:hypothetical protein
MGVSEPADVGVLVCSGISKENVAVSAANEELAATESVAVMEMVVEYDMVEEVSRYDAAK